MKRKSVYIVATTCFILVIAICVQIKTMNKANSTVSQGFKEDGLRDEVLKVKEKYDNTYQQLQQSEKELAKIREKTTQNSTSSTQKETQIKENNQILGLTTVKGQGIELIVKDDPNITKENIGIYDSIDYHIVHDIDLRWIVNALNNAGAEAICINNQRIVNTTAITCVGNVIKINDEKVGSPFTIKAIGLPESLVQVDMAGGYLDTMREWGIVTSLKKVDEITIPKYVGVIKAKYMKSIN